MKRLRSKKKIKPDDYIEGGETTQDGMESSQASVQNLHEECSNLEELLASQQIIIQRLNEDKQLLLAKAENRTAAAESHVQLLEEENASLEASIDELRAALDDANLRYANASHHARQLEDAAHSPDDVIKVLQSQVERTKLEHNETKNVLETLTLEFQDEKKELISTLSSKEKELSDVKQKLNSSIEHNEGIGITTNQLNSRVQELDNECDRLRSENAASASHVSHLTEKLEELGKQLENQDSIAQESISQLRARLKSSEMIQIESRAREASFEKTKSELTNEVERLREELAVSVKQHSFEMSALEASVKQQYDEQYEEKTKFFEQLQATRREETIAEEKQKLDETIKSIEYKTSKRVKELESELAQHIKEKKSLAAIVTQLEKSENESELSATVSDLAEKNRIAEMKVVSLEAQLSEYEKVREHASLHSETQRKTLEAECIELHAHVACDLQKLNELQVELDELRVSFGEERKTHAAELRAARDEIRQKVEENAQVVVDLTKELSNEKASRLDIEDSLRVSEENRIRLETIEMEISSEVESLRDRLEKADAIIKESEVGFLKLQNEKDDIEKSYVGKMSEKNAQVTYDANRIETLEKDKIENDKRRVEAENLVVDLRKTIAELENDLVKQGSKFENLKKEFLLERDELHSQVANVKKESEMKTQELEEKMRKINDELGSVSSKHLELCITNAELTNELNEAHEKLRNFEAKKDLKNEFILPANNTKQQNKANTSSVEKIEDVSKHNTKSNTTEILNGVFIKSADLPNKMIINDSHVQEEILYVLKRKLVNALFSCHDNGDSESSVGEEPSYYSIASPSVSRPTSPDLKPSIAPNKIPLKHTAGKKLLVPSKPLDGNNDNKNDNDKNNDKNKNTPHPVVNLLQDIQQGLMILDPSLPKPRVKSLMPRHHDSVANLKNKLDEQKAVLDTLSDKLCNAGYENLQLTSKIRTSESRLREIEAVTLLQQERFEVKAENVRKRYAFEKKQEEGVSAEATRLSDYLSPDESETTIEYVKGGFERFPVKIPPRRLPVAKKSVKKPLLKPVNKKIGFVAKKQGKLSENEKRRKNRSTDRKPKSVMSSSSKDRINKYEQMNLNVFDRKIDLIDSSYHEDEVSSESEDHLKKWYLDSNWHSRFEQDIISAKPHNFCLLQTNDRSLLDKQQQANNNSRKKSIIPSSSSCCSSSSPVGSYYKSATNPLKSPCSLPLPPQPFC